MQLKKMFVYSLCAISMGAWYKEAKSCCPYEPGYVYSSGNVSCDPSELCPSDKRWRPKPEEPKQEVKVMALNKHLDNEKTELKKPVLEVAQYDIRWQEEEPKKTITSYDIRWK